VQESKKRLHQERGYIEEIIAAVRAGKSRGRTVKELQQEIQPERIHAIGGSDYGPFVDDSVRRHMLIAPGAQARDNIANSVRTNIKNIYEALG
jgi:hypothetical protein